MSNSENIHKHLITGNFTSSFSTKKLENFQFKREMHQSFEFKNITLVGRKMAENVDFIDAVPVLSDDSLFLKDVYVSGVELFPLQDLDSPLEMTKKLNLENVLITNLKITNEHLIQGVMHGTITGVVYAEIPIVVDTEIKSEMIPAPLSSIGADPVGQSSSEVLSPSVPTGSPVVNTGCFSFLKNGCFGFLLFFLLFLLLAFLLRTCNSNTHEERVKTEVPDDEKLIKDNRIIDKDTSLLIDNKTIKEVTTISLPNVQFFTNSDKLLPSSEQELNKLALYLLQKNDLRATVFGHTDNVGSDSKNMLLSQNRAQSVVDHLVQQGVQRERLKAVGKGETEPKASNEILEGRLMNRRVEVEISQIKSVQNIKN
jgi:outer membrane protein OmpA-like peptidoglycan-associated protein